MGKSATVEVPREELEALRKRQDYQAGGSTGEHQILVDTLDKWLAN